MIFPDYKCGHSKEGSRGVVEDPDFCPFCLCNELTVERLKVKGLREAIIEYGKIIRPISKDGLKLALALAKFPEGEKDEVQ